MDPYGPENCPLVGRNFHFNLFSFFSFFFLQRANLKLGLKGRCEYLSIKSVRKLKQELRAGKKRSWQGGYVALKDFTASFKEWKQMN